MLLSSYVVNNVTLACVRDYSRVWRLLCLMESTQCSKTIFLTGGGARTSTGGSAPLPHAGYAPAFIYFKKYKIKLNSRNTIFGYSTHQSLRIAHLEICDWTRVGSENKPRVSCIVHTDTYKIPIFDSRYIQDNFRSAIKHCSTII